MMDALIEIAFLVLGGALALVLIYYFALALASLLPDSRARRQIAASRGEMRFVVLVPAHDEEQLVGRTLESLSAIDYPRDRMSVVVIADNCSDGTEAIVRAAGRECWVRSDPERRGKGHALEWAFARLRKEDSFDAVVVIDADTLVDPQLLRVLEARFAAGAEAVQAYHDVHRPERTPMSSLTYLGVALSRNLKYPGRARLGSSANLLGNGMAFSRRVVAEVGWNAVSVAEDSEFQLELYMRGFRVAFAREARVASEIPARLRAYHAQQKRWNVGKPRLREKYLGALLRKALRERDVGALHLVAELLIPSYTILGAWVYAGWLSQLFIASLSPATRILWHSVAAGFSLYAALGLLLAKASPRVCLQLLLAPLFVVSRAAIVVAGWRGSEGAWTRSER